MKKTVFSKFVLIFLFLPFCPINLSAQEYTQWELPDDAIARLGKGRVRSIKYSPDGNTMAVATSIGIWLYDTDIYQERALLKIKNERTTRILFSPDGKTLASEADSSGTTLWDVETRKPKKTLSTDLPSYSNFTFNPDGKLFATNRGNDIQLWDAKTTRIRLTLTGHTNHLDCLSFSPDGKTLASGSVPSSLILSIAIRRLPYRTC